MRPISVVLLLVYTCVYPAQVDAQQSFFGKTVDGWIAVLRARASTEDERRQAILALGYFGPEAKAAVPDLTDTVRLPGLKDDAVRALIQIGERPDVTVPALVGEFVKRSQMGIVGGAHPNDRDVEDHLVLIGEPAVDALVALLNGPDRGMRVDAVKVLVRIGPKARRASASLIRAIERPVADSEAGLLRLYAVRALVRIGPDAKDAVPALNRLLDEYAGENLSNPSLEFDVVKALDALGAPPVRKLVARFLHEGDSFLAFQLAWLGPKAREAIPGLLSALTDRRRDRRIYAAVALAHIEPSTKEAIPVLIDGLKCSDLPRWGGDVPGALARLGIRAKAALPIMIDLVKEGIAEPSVLEALVQIDPEGKECVPALVSTLEEQDDGLAGTAIECLGLLGPRAKDAIPALAAYLKLDRDKGPPGGFELQVSAARALQRIDSNSTIGIPILIRALKYRPGEWDYSVAEGAAHFLGSLGAGAKSAVPALIEAVRARETDDQNWDVRAAAAWALGQIGPDAEDAVSTLRSLMQELEKDGLDSPEVVIALDQLDPGGKAIADAWLKRPMKNFRRGSELAREVEARALVLGAMGRTSLEADWVTRSHLADIEMKIPRDSDSRSPGMETQGPFFESVGRLGVGARLAIPRLKELRTHLNPWVRMWAAEALAQIERVHQPAAR